MYDLRYSTVLRRTDDYVSSMSYGPLSIIYCRSKPIQLFRICFAIVSELIDRIGALRFLTNK